MAEFVQPHVPKENGQGDGGVGVRDSATAKDFMDVVKESTEMETDGGMGVSFGSGHARPATLTGAHGEPRQEQ
jgi:hypothetical protein